MRHASPIAPDLGGVEGLPPQLLPMSDDMMLAYIWDCLAFAASLQVLLFKNCDIWWRNNLLVGGWAQLGDGAA